MANPYAVMKQAQQQNAQSQPAQRLPSIKKEAKAKMGQSMKRRMSTSQNIDIGKVIQQQQQLEGKPALPLEILNQYETQDMNAHQYPGLPQNSLQKGLERQKSTRSIRSFGSQRRPSVSSSNNKVPAPDVIMADAPPIPAIPIPFFNPVKGIDLHDQNVIDLLNDPNFNADAFISARLSDSNATDIEKFSSNLTTLRKKITNDMRSTALSTHERLIDTTTQLNLTESELKILRNAITELLEITNSMKETAERRVQVELDETSELTKSKSVTKSSRKRAVDRSSVLMLEKLWSTQMTSLFKSVEGAHKFITPIPGRHIIEESGCWYEVNAATFKALQPAHIFLLNDLVLVATRRRKNTIVKNSQNEKNATGLIAEQCWPLGEVTLSEFNPGKTSEGELYAIKITYSNLTYIYQTERYDLYQKILKGYKQARDELRDILDSENIKQKQLRDSLNLLSLNETKSQSQQQKHRSNPNRNSQSLLKDVSAKIHSRSRSLDNSNTLKNLKRIDEKLNDVDISIFHEAFDESIEKINELETDLGIYKDRCNEEESIFFSIISMKVSVKRDEVLKKLINSMNSNSVSSDASDIEKTIKSLNKLNQTTIAETLFLNNRSQYLSSLISKIQESKNLDGVPKVSSYLIEISIVTFQTIKSSISKYRDLFQPQKDSNLAYLVRWSTTHVKDHLLFLQKKIDNLKIHKDEMESLILVLHRQAKQLAEVGLDVEYVLDGFYKSIDSS